jgi:hypothetical protein
MLSRCTKDLAEEKNREARRKRGRWVGRSAADTTRLYSERQYADKVISLFVAMDFVNSFALNIVYLMFSEA